LGIRLTLRNGTAGLAVAFAALTGFFLADYQSSLAVVGQGGGFRSLAAAICQPLWVDGGQNDRALNCYLTSETTRLCRAEERRHLSGILSAYRTESRKFMGNSLWSLFFEPAGPQGGLACDDLQRLAQMTQDRRDGRKFSPEEQAARAAFGRDLLDRMVNAKAEYQKSRFARALTLKPLGDQVLAKSIERLSRQGLMLKADYAWWPDDLVGMAIWGYVVSMGTLPLLSGC
jgi:hypothetical protein